MSHRSHRELRICGLLLTPQDKAVPALETALEKTAGLGARIDLVLAMVRVGLFTSDHALVTAKITSASQYVTINVHSTDARLIDSGGDWERRNRLKVYRALHYLSIRDFKEASELLVDSLSTFTATELMEYDDFVALTVLAAGVGCDRKSIKTKVGLDPSTGADVLDHCLVRSDWLPLVHPSSRQHDRIPQQIQLFSVFPLASRG